MEIIKDYLLLITPNYIEIFNEFIGHKAPSSTIKKAVLHKSIKRQLLEQPYPTLQIFQPFAFKNQNIQICIYDVLNEYFNLNFNHEKHVVNFLNYLANSHIPAHYIEQINEVIFPKIYEQKDNFMLDIYFSMLAREDCALIFNYLKYEIAVIPVWKKKSMIWEAIYKNENVFLYLFEAFPLEIEQKFISNVICLNKLIYIINELRPTLEDFQQINRIFETLSTIEMNFIQKIIYAHIYEVYNAFKVVRKYSYSTTDIQQILDETSTLDVMYRHIPIVHIGYEECKSVLENNLKLFIIFPSISKKNNEIEMLSYFFILVTFFEVIVCGNRAFEVIEDKFQIIHVMFRQIKNINVLSCLIEDIFRLLLFRWEYVNSLTKSQECRHGSTDSDNVETSYSTTAFGLSERYGFICKGQVLKDILKLLKTLITKRFHTEEYKSASTESQMRFTGISEMISNSLWKHNLIEKNSIDSNSFAMDNSEIFKILQSHFDSHGRNSSDAEITKRRYSNASRQKVKIKKKNSVMSSYSSKDKSREDNTKVKRQLRKEGRNIVAKLLGSPENLVALSLGAGNLQEAKEIIQIFNLHSTDFERELTFLENMSQAKQKLQVIYEKYKEEEIRNSSNSSTIQRIRRVAAVGFEASKISNVIEKFSSSNVIYQDESAQKLIQKHSNNFSFLHQYIGNTLQISVILDIVLNLNFDYEIISNIVSLAERLYAHNLNGESIQSSVQSSFLENSKNLGCFPFLKNFAECMYLWKNAKKDALSVKKLLVYDCYSLQPAKVSSKIVKEDIFQKICSKNVSEFGSIKNLKGLHKLFEDLNSKINYFSRICSYVWNLSQLLQLRDKNIDISVSEMMQLDPRVIIGDLIFEENMTPLEIEGVVAALNLNFLHIITLNICPDASKSENELKLRFHKRDVNANSQSVLNYIATENNLLGFLLKKINNMECNSSGLNSIFFDRLYQLPENQNISLMYEGNTRLSSLMQDKLDIQRLAAIKEKLSLINIANSFTENTNELNYIKILRNKTIVEDFLTGEKILAIDSIWDINLRVTLLCDNYTKIHDSLLAEKFINSTLLHTDFKKLSADTVEQLQTKLKEVRVYTEIALIYDFRTWTQAYDFSQISPLLVVENLLKVQKYRLCYEWSKMIDLPKKCMAKYKTLFSLFLCSLTEITRVVDKNLLNLIETFPVENIIQFYENNLEKFRSLPLLDYIVEFFFKNCDYRRPIYDNYRISIKIFEQLNDNKHDQDWNLFSKPLLLIEQLIMNTKFETLSKILKTVRTMINANFCKYCSNKQGNIYDIYSKTNTYALGSENASEFLLLNFNLYQKDHVITHECVDLLLRIYATKALDYHINEIYSSSEKVSQSTDLTSLDSLCGTFVMPKYPPSKENWIRDEDAVHCMCCKRSVFTMLIRRHHCRRCGRVVCFSCSANRMKIKELYQNVPVRICNDCLRQTQAIENKTNQKNICPNSDIEERYSGDEKWLLSGNLTHDKLLREEFCYEHTPSVALCVSILSFHLNDQEYVRLLLYHCRKLEKLLRPNPEVDYALVAKMIHCLAVAAKVRGGPPECDMIRDHSEIIMSIAQNGCEALLPIEPTTNHSLRKLGDSLVSAQKWSLALDMFLKCGFPTTGVIAAHGLSCLRGGCYDTAREKFAHCLTCLCSEEDCLTLSKLIKSENITELIKQAAVPVIKRPNRSPPLLEEILKIIECSTNSHHPETIARASIIRSSNTSLASTRLKRKENIPLHEPALNILNTLSNLKQISKGNYGDRSVKYLDNEKFIKRQSRIFEESIYYILSYGSHSDLINFLIKNGEVSCSLRYYVLQELNPDIFVQNIYLKHLKMGKVDVLIRHMIEMDERLLIWKDAIIHTCRYLESKNLLNCLYQLQILLKDVVRASMTCVKFYSMNCSNFWELKCNSFHLINARNHLQTELEWCHWEDIKIERKWESSETSFLMQLDERTLNSHINTILSQLEVTKFLARCESERPETAEILKQIRLGIPGVPTLFDSVHEKIQLCVLILLCGRNIEEGFGLTFRIIQDYKLSPIKVYGATAKSLSSNSRLKEVENLINCIKSNNGKDKYEIDEIVSVAIHTAVNIHEPETKTTLDNLIKKIDNIDKKISCHIYIGQLKSAYLLAVQYNKINDIRRILRHAEMTNQFQIKKLCEKKLNTNS